MQPASGARIGILRLVLSGEQVRQSVRHIVTGALAVGVGAMVLIILVTLLSFRLVIGPLR